MNHRTFLHDPALVLLASLALGLACPAAPAQEAQPGPPTDASAAAVQEALALRDDPSLPLQTREEIAAALVERFPARAELWAVLGELREEQGSDSAALLAFQRAVALDDSLHSAWHWIGLLERRLATGPDGLEASLAALRKAIDRGMPRAVGLNESASTLARLGRMAEAAALLDQALELDPSWGVLYANAAKVQLELGNLRRAVDLARASLSASRYEQQAVLHVGWVLEESGKVDDALALYGEAVASHPGLPKLRFAFGSALLAKGRRGPASVQLAEALRLAEEQGDLDTANKARVTLFAAEHPEDHKRMIRGEQLLREALERPTRAKGRLEEAVKLMDQVVAAHPDLWEALLQRGAARRQLGQPDAARADFLRVLDHAAGQPDALVNLAMVARDLGDCEDARARASEAAAVAERDPFITLNAALVLAGCGDCAKALELRDRIRGQVPPESSGGLLETLDERLEDAGCRPIP